MPQSVKRPGSGVPGAKMLITAVSVAATLGGWALITANDAKPVAQVTTVSQSARSQSASALVLPPLPTLVPPPAGVMNTLPRQPSAPDASAGTNQAAAPVLRVVDAPPPPVATTRSSR